MADKSNRSEVAGSKSAKSVTPVPGKRNPYEQQEYQRTHTYAFTTLTQSVNPDGSLITFSEVTSAIQRQLNRLQVLHDNHDYWWLFAPKDQQDMYFYLLDQLDKARQGFVANYERFHQDEDFDKYYLGEDRGGADFSND